MEHSLKYIGYNYRISETKCKNLCHFLLSKDFLVKTNCKRKSKLVFIKIENFCSSKDTAIKMKRQNGRTYLRGIYLYIAYIKNTYQLNNNLNTSIK